MKHTDLPPDLARPRDPEGTRYRAGLIVGSALILLNLGMIAWVVVT